MVQFGDHLRQTRLESGLTQADVANRLRVSKGYISRLESGKARPAEATVRRLAQICETDPAFFEIAKTAIPQLATLEVNGENKPAPSSGEQPSLFG